MKKALSTTKITTLPCSLIMSIQQEDLAVVISSWRLSSLSMEANHYAS